MILRPLTSNHHHPRALAVPASMRRAYLSFESQLCISLNYTQSSQSYPITSSLLTSKSFAKIFSFHSDSTCPRSQFTLTYRLLSQSALPEQRYSIVEAANSGGSMNCIPFSSSPLVLAISVATAPGCREKTLTGAFSKAMNSTSRLSACFDVYCP